MKHKLFGYLKTNRRGLALITVLGVVTLATILILALFSVSDAEYKASKSYLEGSKCRVLADNAVNLVISQIQSGATGATVATKGNPTIWASQPGAVRVYSANGTFMQGRKLYSSHQMVVPGGNPGAEQTMSTETPLAAWDQAPTRWVDINEPVNVLDPQSGNMETYFPILDPRAGGTRPDPRGGTLAPIEGFTFVQGLNKVPSKATVSGLANGSAALQLPMPVEWLYVLQDGTMGTLSGGAGGGAKATWNGAVAGGGKPSETNPIIGRMAFWTDDESCRINVNTAAEPGGYVTPRVFHDRDKNWADSPPVVYEYQRWPGHPATVALSSVLAPNANQASGIYDGDSYPHVSDGYRQLKNAIYDIAPKIAIGGSDDGTKNFTYDGLEDSMKSTREDLFKNITDAKRTERRYASVDDMIFRNGMTNGTRKASKVEIGGSVALTATALERARFFLTANSRAPETNMFGLPRVAIWPVPDKPLGPNYRTPYDEAIALAATLGNPQNSVNTYYFSRRDSNSSVADLGGNVLLQGTGLKRNSDLLSYLDRLTHHIMPGVNNLSFASKYGRDQRQILVEIFDYIRCTNLYDAFLDDRYVKEHGGRDKWDDGGAGGPPSRPFAGYKNIDPSKQQALLWKNRPKQFGAQPYYTYTAPRFETIRRARDIGVPTTVEKDVAPEEHVTSGAYPGHGQVKPIEWTPTPGPGEPSAQTYKGFGRFPTISEVALHFICTGDGKTDAGSFVVQKGDQKIRSGGKTAQKIDPLVYNKREALKANLQEEDAMWYSNIPPFPGRKYFEDAGCDFGKINSGVSGDPLKHPAANAANWNCTLEYNQKDGGIALAEDEKRIQIALQLELFVPSVGYTKYTPDFTIVLNGDQLSNLQVKDAKGVWRPIFQTTSDQVVRSTSAYMGSLLGQHAGNNAVNPMGGTYGPRALMAGRQAKAPGGSKMVSDPGYQSNANGDPHAEMLNFPLISNYFTVKRDQPIKFRSSGGTDIQADIYASHDYKGDEDKQNSAVSQSVSIKFPEGEQSTPPPWLVVFSSEYRQDQDLSGNITTRDAVNAVRWWAFNDGGAVGRYVGRGKPGKSGVDFTDVVENRNVGNAVKDHQYTGTWGRFHGGQGGNVLTSDLFNKINKGGIKARVPISGVIYGYSDLTDFSGVQSDETDLLAADIFVPGGDKKMGGYKFYGSDAIRSLVPKHGDYRLLAAMKNVPGSVWTPHRLWDKNVLFAHNLSGNRSDSETGYDNGHDLGAIDVKADKRLVKDVWYPIHQVPDTPQTDEASKVSTSSRDFDNGPGDIRDGAYINKPDEGNMSAGKFWWAKRNVAGDEGDDQLHLTRNAYFMSSFLQLPASNSYFTPNRMISSPGLFGSLPTGVFGSGPGSNPDGVPWRTLLFRPDVMDPTTGKSHYGAPSWAGTGAQDPADHYFMDLFWMPVIEPYLISDAYSTAGKINVNFQMLPFSHITRATGLHAVLKGESITAISSSSIEPAKKAKGLKPSKDNPVVYKLMKDDVGTLNKAQKIPHQFWTDADGMAWHRAIDREITTKQLIDRFTCQSTSNPASWGLLRTASQICEIHLWPRSLPPYVDRPMLSNGDQQIKASMSNFWDDNKLTGDNSRENPYANIYQKITTRSNTFRTYFRVQTLKKARSSKANEFDDTKDTVTGEYRGSALIERYLNLDGTPLPDYPSLVDPFSADSLEKSYHYRVLEMKQFAP